MIPLRFPLISVPGAVVAKYSDYARELEYTESWMKVNTVNHRVGIGITQNLTVPFQVVGSANITSVNATGELHSPDGYNVHQLDYLKLVNLDDYSLSPYDAPSRTDNNAPTRDVVFVTTVGNVGVNIDVTANIQEPLHVSGNLKVDHAAIKGNSNIELVGTSLASTGTYNSEKQLIWNSQKGFFVLVNRVVVNGALKIVVTILLLLEKGMKFQAIMVVPQVVIILCHDRILWLQAV